MSVKLQAILDEVTGNFIWFIIGLAIAGVWRVLQTRFVGRAILGWQFRPPFTVVIGSPFGIVPGTTTLSNVSGLPIFGFGPLNALHSVWNLLNRAFRGRPGPIPLVTSKTFDSQCYSNSLVSIGYPIGNPVTLELLEAIRNIPIKFDGHRIRNASSGAIAYEPTYSNGKVVSDYGVLVVGPNPFNPDARVIILAGTETFGVKAAADLLSYKYIHHLYGTPAWVPGWLIVAASMMLRRSRKINRVVIVSCAVNDLYVSPPQIVSALRF